MSELTITLTMIEAINLRTVVDQFVELLADSDAHDPQDDPALARLVPDAYRDDRGAAEEFRRLTQSDLLTRRRTDAESVAGSLQRAGATDVPGGSAGPPDVREIEVRLTRSEVDAWLRTLAAIRLVVATRLGITSDDDDLDHPRFGVYHWLGYRLDGLIESIDG